MPDSVSRLPARPSLEQLRKQAKDRLKALRTDRADATLADAQFTLAREYGFDSWAALARHVETVNPSGLGRVHRIAAELATAYTAGDVDAVREINWTYGTSFAWHQESEAMQRQLPTWFASEQRRPELALEDARNLVARRLGSSSWADLVAGMTRARSAKAPPDESPVYRLQEHTIHVNGAIADHDWDVIVDLIAERDIRSAQVHGLTDRGLEQLARATRITRLSVDGAQLSDDGLRTLARMPQLEEFSLGGPRCRVTDRGLEPLRHLRALKRFSACWVPGISDAGIAHLGDCDDLEHVDLMGTQTGDGALAALAGKAHLASLSTGRLVSDAGIARLREFPVFRRRFTGDVQYDLMSFQAQPNHLLLDGPFTDAGLAALAELEGLVSLNLFWHATGFTSAGLRALKTLPSLVFVGCDGKRCDDEAMRQLAAIPRLRMLMAQGAIATDAGFEALSASPTLEYLWGRECPHLSGLGFIALTSMPSLRGLAVSCARVDDEALASLAHSGLTSLVPMDVSDAGFRHVGRCMQLEHLWCMYCRDTTDAATEHLTTLSHLKSYYAGMTKITDRSLAILSRLTTLERLEFWEIAGITDAGLQVLATLPALRAVTIGGPSQVTSGGLAQFGQQVSVTRS